ncbi:MAG: undecaprenyl-diphosphate phosphatase [Alphaproteobacteria bacterium]|nr:undecaprenyl-diphosphate phosphatase [Alphaproteobacteria bacterium]QQS57654.1 MAG: undecaprenyl-diphosphate phosphatase [Alphaproteobacteria bacterium]
MSDFSTAALLGFIEGLTEFLPVSSTAHLLILTDLFKFAGPPGHLFEIFIQLGAIFAVVVLYRKKLFRTAFTLHSDPASRHFATILLIGTLPALVAGAIGRDFIKGTLYNNPLVIGTTLILGGLIMLIVERNLPKARIENIQSVPLKTAVMIGCCQALALIPGVSRSGASIIGGLMAGLSRPAAAELSFFLAIPVMFLAVAYDLYKSWDSVAAGDYLALMLTGFGVAFVTALVVIKALLGVVNRYGFYPFAVYRLFAGAFVFWAFW